MGNTQPANGQNVSDEYLFYRDGMNGATANELKEYFLTDYSNTWGDFDGIFVCSTPNILTVINDVSVNLA
eukprot:scaffold58118_cov37-Cyclotella_meneghiniana.AAC.7